MSANNVRSAAQTLAGAFVVPGDRVYDPLTWVLEAAPPTFSLYYRPHMTI